MSYIQFQPSQSPEVPRWPALLVLAIMGCLVLISVKASAQLAANQTNGFGNSHLVTFTYLQNFDCVDQPETVSTKRLLTLLSLQRSQLSPQL